MDTRNGSASGDAWERVRIGFLALFGTVAMPGLHAQEEPWQRDIAAFDAHLGKLVAGARTPSSDEFSERVREVGWDESGLTTITDGAGGYVDHRPPVGTVQFEVNEALKGRQVRWEFVVGDEPSQADQFALAPTWDGRPDVEAEGDPKEFPYLGLILFAGHVAGLPSPPLEEGHRVVLEGTIGDFSTTDETSDSFRGPTAIHHLEAVPHPIFWLGMEDVRIRRLSPSDEELSVLRLSDRPVLERTGWKVLGESGGAAIDGDEETVWAVAPENDEPASLVIDLGGVESIHGLRYRPPRDHEATGGFGACEVRVSASLEAFGEPVATATFLPRRDEQELEFPQPASGRYVKIEARPVGGPRAAVAAAGVELLGEAVVIPEVAREPALPPMAEEIERFELLRDRLADPPEELGLTVAQQEDWRKVHREARSWWYERHDRPLGGFITDENQWNAAHQAAARQDLSPAEEANFYAVLALPGMSSEAQREEMAAMAESMKATRREFLAAIKRLLTHPQQETLAILLRPAATAPLTPGGWRELFDGSTLDGWDGDPRFWSVEDGAITGRTTESNGTESDTFLVFTGKGGIEAPESFANFRLTLEFRIEGNNSGIEFRSARLPDSDQRWQVGGYQADFDSAGKRTGALQEDGVRGILAARGTMATHDRIDGRRFIGQTPLGEEADLAAHLAASPEWNRMEIVALGNRLSHSINDVLMSRVVDNDQECRRADGLIAIQLDDGEPMTVQVRRIRLQPLGNP